MDEVDPLGVLERIKAGRIALDPTGSAVLTVVDRFGRDRVVVLDHDASTADREGE